VPNEGQQLLKIYSPSSHGPQAWQPGASVPGSPIWLDLISPTEAELQQANQILGAALPTREETSAIELSSRLNASEKLLRVNIPFYARAEGDQGPSTPLGFVLSPTLLATIRYAESFAFNHVTEALKSDCGSRNGADIFIEIQESIVDVAADRMEAMSAELAALSQRVFSEERDRRNLLRRALFNVGAMQRNITQLRAALLGVSRVVAYLCDISPDWISKAVHSRFLVVHADIASLNEFNQQLSERLQFLLDAVLGFINNDQNDIMRVLTIVSVITVPPMILAGIWGMNFKSIPEYDWPHGYAFALAMIALSILLPLLAFKWKKWL
jgi:magnesium transporter